MAQLRSTQSLGSNGGLFPRTRQSLATLAKRIETRERVARELALLSDRALSDIGIYRSDINRFAIEASNPAQGEAVIRAVAADLKALFRGRKATRYLAKAAE